MTGFNQGEFLDLVYGAAIEPDLWAPVMERFADAIGGDMGWLSLLDLITGRGSGVIARIDPLEVDRFDQYYAHRNPLHLVDDPRGFLQNWRPRILTDEDWMEKSALVTTEYYNDFLRPQNVHSCMMIRLAKSGVETATINISRPLGRDQFGGAELEFAQSLHHHFIRAFDLGQKLAVNRVMSSGFATVFDESVHGLFLVTADGRVQHMNRAAEAMATAQRGLRISAGRLAAIEPSAGRALQALVGRAGSRETQERTGGSMPLPVAGSAAPLAVTVAPVRLPTVAVLGGAPAVIVCVTDTSAGVKLPEHRLRDLFGLTPAEARLALALFEGATLNEAAEGLKISRFTAQNHLARIFEKTGANRQATLIQLMMRAVGLDLGSQGSA